MSSEALPIKGGAGRGVIKTHLKQSGAVKALGMRAIQYYDKAYNEDDLENDEAVPEELTPLLGPIQEELAQITAGDYSIKNNIKFISTEKLEMIKEILGEGRGGHTEEKILRVVRLSWPQVGKLTGAKAYINRMLGEFMKQFLVLYSQQYNIYRNGMATFANEAFKADVTRELNIREGASAERVVNEGGRCVIM